MPQKAAETGVHVYLASRDSASCAFALSVSPQTALLKLSCAITYLRLDESIVLPLIMKNRGMINIKIIL